MKIDSKDINLPISMGYKYALKYYSKGLFILILVVLTNLLLLALYISFIKM